MRIVRVLSLVLLLHHVEGVCKPRSAVGRLVANFVSKAISRTDADQATAVARAQLASLDATERASTAAQEARRRAETAHAARYGVQPQAGSQEPPSRPVDDTAQSAGSERPAEPAQATGHVFDQVRDVLDGFGRC